MIKPEPRFDIRPPDLTSALREYDQKVKQQTGRYHQHLDDVNAKTLAIEAKQRQAELNQKAKYLENVAKSNPVLGQSHTQSMKTQASMAEAHKDVAIHRERGKLLRPDIYNINDDPFEEFSEKLPPEPARIEVVQRPQERPVVVKEESSSSDDEDEIEQMNKVSQQNEAIKNMLSKLKQQRVSKEEAGKYQAEMEKLNALEAKLYDYNRHVESMKGLSRLGDDMNRMARNQALAAIKAGQARKDAEMRDLLKQLAPTSKNSANRDPWARKMIQAMMANNQPQARNIDPTFFNQPAFLKPEKSVDSEEKLKQDKKIKKLNAELEKNKKALEKLQKNEKSVEKAPEKPEGLLNKEEVAKAIDDALKKQAEDIEKKAREAGAGPEDVVTLPNGISIIKPKDKSKPPIFVMPPPEIENVKKNMQKTKSSISSTSSISETMAPKPNPLQQMMLGMLMSQNMKMMMGDDQSSASKTESRKSYSSSHSKLPPLIINPPVYYPPHPPPVSQSLPKVQKIKPKPKPAKKEVEMKPQPSHSQLIAPVPIPTTLPPIQPTRPASVKSESTNGQAIQPPVKIPVTANYSSWNLEGPRPAANIDLESSPSFRDAHVPSQGSFF